MPSFSAKPVLHYLDLGSLGRGEVVRLFMKDAGVDFQDIRYKFDKSWKATSDRLQTTGLSRTGKVPVLQLDGVNYSQHVPILRYLAREVGGYDGETSYEKYIVDAVSDLYIDWRFHWAANLGAVKDEYKNDFVPKYYNVLSQFYQERGGPYLLGQRVTYADFAVYQSIDNDEKVGTLPEKLPELIAQFRQAFEARPGVQAYLASGRDTKE